MFLSIMITPSIAFITLLLLSTSVNSMDVDPDSRHAKSISQDLPLKGPNEPETDGTL